MTTLNEVQKTISSLNLHSGDRRVSCKEPLVQIFQFLREHTNLYDITEGKTEADLHSRLIEVFSLLPCRDLPAEARAKAEEERLRAEQIARAKAEAERLRAEEEARIKVEAERLRAEEEARIKAEAERLRAEEEARIKAEAERLRVEEEARIKAEIERLRAEEEARVKAETERLRKEEEARARAEAERFKAEEDARIKAEASRINAEREAQMLRDIDSTVEAELTESAEKLLKDLKLRRKYRYLVLKIVGGDVLPDCTGVPSAGPAQLQSALPYSDCRYCIYDQEYVTDDGRKASRLLFISWLPHNAMPHSKMAYVHGKIAVRRRMEGLFDVAATSFKDVQAALGIADEDESESDSDA